MAPAARPEKTCWRNWCIVSPSVAQIGATNLRIGGKRLGGPRCNDITRFEQISVIGQFQRQNSVLFHKQYADVLLALDAAHDGENVVNDPRGKPERRLVEYQESRRHH